MKRLAIIAAILVLAFAAVTACGSSDGAPTADQPLPTPQTSTEDTATMQSSPMANGTPITINIDGRAVKGILHDNATARSLIGQLPLTLTFKDHGGQEKSARLPAPLSLEGMPAGSDADPLTIGYYAPDQVLVLYYEHVGRFNGIVRIGTFEDLVAVRDQPDGFTAKLDLAS
ncbi:cyclophilin-like fold protein [Arthrobacter sp. D1-29]